MFELLLFLGAFCIFTLWFANHRINKLTQIVNLEEKTRQEDLLALSMDFRNTKDHLLDLFFSANSDIKHLDTSIKGLSTQIQDLDKLFSSGLAEQFDLILSNDKHNNQQISSLSEIAASLIKEKEELQKYKVDLEDRVRRVKQQTSDLEKTTGDFFGGVIQSMNDSREDFTDFVSRVHDAIKEDRESFEEGLNSIADSETNFTELDEKICRLNSFLNDLSLNLSNQVFLLEQRLDKYEEKANQAKQTEVQGFISGTLQAFPLHLKLETDIGFLAHEILRINNSIRELTESLNQVDSKVRSNSEQIEEKISSLGAQNLIADCISPLQEKLSSLHAVVSCQEDSRIEADHALNELREKTSALDSKLGSLLSKIRSMV